MAKKLKRAFMGDMREQLAPIRSMVPKAKPVDAPDAIKTKADIKVQKGAQGNASHPTHGSAQPRDIFERLSAIGNITNVKTTGGFGFVNRGGQSYFFHATGRLSATTRQLTDDLNNRNILFAIGPSEKDGRQCAVCWALVDDISWPNESTPNTQSELDELRTKWFLELAPTQIINCLLANWHKGPSTPSGKCTGLVDDLLETQIIRALQSLTAQQWRDLKVREALQSERYQFLSNWNWRTDQIVPKKLMKHFSAEHLALLGPPRQLWASSITDELKHKLIEWAAWSSLDALQSQRWKLDIENNFHHDVEAATNLLESKWTPTELGVKWVKRLLRSGRLPATKLQERLIQNPAEEPIWVKDLTSQLTLDLLIAQYPSPSALAARVAEKKDPVLTQMALYTHSVAIDIESDGTTIWEIGVAEQKQNALILARDDAPEKLTNALNELTKRIKMARVIVGHNVINWDWEILSSKLPERVNPLLWDTMLVSFMLEPWKASHALGGNHRADTDAQEAFQLFASQLERIGGSVAIDLLSGEIQSTAALMSAIGVQLQRATWTPPSLPAALANLGKAWSQEKALIVSAYWIPSFNWIPGIDVVSADDQATLSIAHLAIDAKALMDAVGPELPANAFATALCAVLRRASDNGTPIRYSMLPIWIRETPSLNAAIRSAASAAGVTGNRHAVAVYPTRATWYEQERIKNYLFLDPPRAGFLAEAGWSKASELPLAVQKCLLLGGDAPRSGTQYRVRIGKSPEIDIWVSLDPAAVKLSKSGKIFRTVKTIVSLRADPIATVRASNRLPSKPRLLVRDDTTLYPGAQDQASYWKSVIGVLRSVTSRQNRGTVCILLIGSSASTELVALIEQSLCELSMTASRADRHSRADRLRMAALVDGGCLVDLMDMWQEWNSLGLELGIPICPIVECLPISDWFAADPGDLTTEELPNADTDDPDDFEDGSNDVDTSDQELDAEEGSAPLNAPLLISGANIAARTPDLLKSNLEPWLIQAGLASSPHACVIIDPRVSLRQRDIRQIFEHLEWKEPRDFGRLDDLLAGALEPLEVKRQAAPSDYESMRAFLGKYWNLGKKPDDPSWISDFREKTQVPAIHAICDRAADVLITLPTGEGKSVLFQVPALCRGILTRRLSIVISPLRALMRDQVQRLWNLGFHQSVDYLTADRPIHEIDDVFQGVLDHRIVLLYVAPERFRSRRFIDVLDRRYNSDSAFEYVVVDEAHCVSQWGYEFRPDYFFALSSICTKYRIATSAEKTPILLLSATVTAVNREHLARLIGGRFDDTGRRYLEFKARPEQYFHPIRNHIQIRPKSVPGRINSRPGADWPIDPRLEIILELVTEAQNNVARTKQNSALIVFVARRDHAEELSYLIGKQISESVECFHAGLDSEAREDVYQRFLDGSISVLVATKAFGMGMDIPHIHWSVHLSPPTFLEDYLQEVGRIGRGEDARKQAKLDRLSASLLYSAEDFETNRTFIQRNRIELRQVSDLYDAIRLHSRMAEEGVLLTMMPDAGFESFESIGKRRASCVQVRKILYWLERLGQVEILTMMPGLLPVKLNFKKLSSVAEAESGPIADVARLLYSAFQAESSVAEPTLPETNVPRHEKRSILDRIIGGLTTFVGMLLGSHYSGQESITGPSYSPPVRQRPAVERDAIINLGFIWRDSSLPHIDDVLSAVAELEVRNCLVVMRKISFSRRRYSHATAQEIEELFDTLQAAAVQIVKSVGVRSEWVIDFDVIPGVRARDAARGSLLDVRATLERAVCYLVRFCGVRIRNRITKGNLELVASFGGRQATKVKERVGVAVSATRKLWKKFVPLLNQEERVIEISSLLSATRGAAADNRFRECDLRRHLGLLGALRLVSVSESLVPMSYVLGVNNAQKGIAAEDNPDVWEELGRVNRLTELRGDALEVFVHLPVEARDHFIEGYFGQTTSEGMETFLTEQLGKIIDDNASAFIEGKREQLQARAVDKFLARFTVKPEEPNQWLAVTHPFDRHLLVNAGPGSGKTSVLIARLAYLIQFERIRPEEILVLAFNRAVVFEIRARVRELFDKLGYGAYVRRLNVATFHSYAIRHLGRSEKYTSDWKEDRTSILRIFADQLETDPIFRASVSRGLRTLLVDEFQDVNEEIFRIVRILSSSAGPSVGVMVIGDDDQDILRWNRSGAMQSDEFFRRFIRDYSLESKDILTLSVNFRSGPEIVAKTQEFLTRFFRVQGGPSPRLKYDTLRAASWAKASTVESIGVGLDGFTAALAETRNELKNSAASRTNTFAILCRTNVEVALAYHSLVSVCPGLVVRNSASYPISRMRHLGVWLDLLKLEFARHGDRPLSKLLFEGVQAVYMASVIPEAARPRSEDISPRQLWDLCCRELSYPFLSHLIEFVESLDSEDLLRLLGADSSTRAVVSTIHKVKGLEFDEVIVLPSTSDFVASKGRPPNASSVEEVRLFYVALTRAKCRVKYYVGPREQSWFRARDFQGDKGIGKLLDGSPKEIGISWAWETTRYNPNAEVAVSYINERVRVGDKLFVGGNGRNLIHSDELGKRRQIGYLANDVGSGGGTSDLVVSAVLRCAYEGNQYFGGTTAQSIVDQGWGLVVLASGVLR